MDTDISKTSNAVKFCTECWICKYTRNCKKRNVLYYICRLAQKICPCCYIANKRLKKGYQKSRYF
jgi:hypothetical protein